MDLRKISYKSFFELERIDDLSIMENYGPCYWGIKGGATRYFLDYIISFYDKVKGIEFLIGSVWEFDKYAILEIDEECPNKIRKIIEGNSGEAAEKEKSGVEGIKGSNLIKATFNREIIFDS